MFALIRKNLVVIGVVIAAIAVLYYFYSSGSSGALLTAETESPVSQEILATLGNLRTIKLDNTVFSDPLFLSLSDFGVTIPPAAAGRRNPFAPVGQGGTTATSSAAAGATTGTTTPR